jgi:hypothetical protein
MTRRTNARIAGIAFLLYIAATILSLVLFGRATSEGGVAATLSGIAEHVTDVRVVVLLDLIMCFCAIVLGVTLWAITREQDRDLAMLALICRVAEGLIGVFAIPSTLNLLWLATSTGANALDTGATHALAAYLLRDDVSLSATFFAVGSTLFSWLLLRGRMIPVLLAWLGVVASVLLVVVLPLRLAGFLGGPITEFVWIPMGVFEVTLALWLIIKGVSTPAKSFDVV